METSSLRGFSGTSGSGSGTPYTFVRKQHRTLRGVTRKEPLPTGRYKSGEDQIEAHSDNSLCGRGESVRAPPFPLSWEKGSSLV